MGAVFAALDMAAKCRGAACLDCRHDAKLSDAHMCGVVVAPCLAVAAEDLRQLQARLRHRRADQAGGDTPELQVLQRALDLPDRVDRDPCIPRGRIVCRCPSKSRITRMSTLRSSRWVAKQWRSVWTVTVLPRPAASAVARQARCNERGVIGWSGSRPGKSHPCGRSVRQ